MRISKENTAAIIVDLQEKLLPVMHNTEEVIRTNKILISGLKELGVPTIFSQQYPQGLGNTITEIQDLVDDFQSFDKTEFSCFGHEMCKSFLNANQVKNVIISGIESHICVLQTAIDLKEAGYNPIIIVDAVDSRTKLNKKIALRRFEAEGITLATYESILFELTGSAKNLAFRTISKLIK